MKTERESFENQFAELVVMESDELKTTAENKSEEVGSTDNIKDDIEKIARILLDELSVRVRDLEIELSFEDSAVSLLADKSYDERLGARPLRRVITREIEDTVSEKILRGEFCKGQSITVSAKDGEIVFE